jgi:hypothetical protein
MGISAALGSSALLPAGLGFRNLIINGGFDIWQRGTSFTNPASSTGFTADRFFPVYDGSGATRIISQGQFDPYVSGASITATPPPGTGADYFLRWNQSVAGTGGTYNILYNRIEDVRLIAGQQVTLSFYAKAGASLTMPTIDIEQYFGSGGSPSANVYTTVTSNVAVTTSWQRFSYTFSVPSAAGKVIGSNANSSFTSIRLWLPSNATFTFDIWGVQLERNYQPTPFEQRPIGVELALCQRYYYRWATGTAYSPAGYINGVTTGLAETIVQMPVTMRVTPTALEKSGSWTGNGTGWVLGSGTFTLDSGASTQHMASILCTSSATFTAFYAYHLIALNNSAAYFALYAEL